MAKRSFDIVIAIVIGFALLPLLLLTAILVRINLGSPILFRQERPGHKGVPFELIKFRTMRDSLGANGEPRPDHERITPFGKLLRTTSIDELPELWNVLKGEMSLVGPRPLLMGYLPLYNERQMRRHNVRPGITGWAQVNGRNAISWEQKFELDLYYVKNQSLWLDAKILLMTVKKVFAKEGISSETSATMEKFTGNERN